ncbi:MAG: hypothetical protein ACYDB1_00645 [Acidiferrobacteraceae bacterium]
MTDLEITRLCAEAMNFHYRVTEPGSEEFAGISESRVIIPDNFGCQGCVYKPLTDDAQAMALVKKVGLVLGRFRDGHWTVDGPGSVVARSDDLNRAICECVARMQLAKARK